ncbi:hypothetical protein [Micromonospora sp. NPDC048898]|uniref:hypothetical protein n=1 Tax=Micromonospora sp. NPDC048898 TaxID=3364260 RepID=UPI00371214F4
MTAAGGFSNWSYFNKPFNDSRCKYQSVSVARMPENNRLDVFVHLFCDIPNTAQAYTFQAVLIGDTWHGWYGIMTPSYGYLGTSGPSATFANQDRLDIFGQSTDSRLLQWGWQNPDWFGFYDHGAPKPSGYHEVLTSGPAATWTRNGSQLHVFGRGPDYKLHYTKYTAAGWENWVKVDANLNSEPSVAAHANGNRIDVFYQGGDNAVWQVYHLENGGWQPRVSLGGNITSPPTATWVPNGSRLDVFARGTDGYLYQKFWTAGGGWSGWFNLGGQMEWGKAPAASWRSDGNRLDMFVITPDDRLAKSNWICC